MQTTSPAQATTDTASRRSTVDQITLRRRGAGLIAHDPALSAGGYTLIAPQTADGNVYLVDIEGEVAHQWKMPVRPGRAAVILANGNLGYNGNHPDSPEIYAAWSLWHGGQFSEVTPEGEVVWSYEDPMHHHDARWLDNGHLLYAACDLMPPEIAARVPGGAVHGDAGAPMYGDVIREVDRSGRIVWEWKAWEHLVPEDFPINTGFGRTHWPLVNGLDLTRDGLVLMSLRVTSGIIGVDKASMKTALHIGPGILSHQHAPVELESGNILAFDNGNFRYGSHVAFSRIVEIDPKTQTLVWSYQDELVNAFYSAYMGSAQRLSNGNTHITESATGRLFEVTPQREVVWEYVIPWFAEYSDEAARRYVPGRQNSVFQTFRYTKEQLPWLKTKPKATSSSTLRGLALSVTLAAIGALGSIAAPPAAAQEPKPVRILSNWFAQADQAGYWQAQQDNLGKEAGIKISVLQGGPKIQTIPQVASGQAEFGIGNADDVLLARLRGAPVKAVFAHLDYVPYSLVYHTDPGVKAITDLKDRTFAVNIGNAYWEWTKKKYQMSGTREIPVSGDLSLFRNDPKMVQQGYSLYLPARMEAAGIPVQQITMASLGYRPYDVLFTTDEMIQKNPALVKATIAAVQKGWNNFVHDPSAIKPLLMGMNQQIAPPVHDAAVKVMIETLISHDLGKIGCMNDARWSELAAQLRTVAFLPAGFNEKLAYDRSFVPGCAP